MTNTTVETTEAEIRLFIELVNRGVDALVEAGKLVAKMIEKDEGVIDRICKQCPSMTPEIVIRFEQVGLRKLHPNLLVFDGHGPEALARLPYELQDKYSKEPVPLLIQTANGHWDILKTDVRNLTRTQAMQVFYRDGVRSEAAQRSWIESRALKQIAPSTKSNLPYKTSGKSLIVLEPCTLTAKEIAGILAQMS